MTDTEIENRRHLYKLYMEQFRNCRDDKKLLEEFVEELVWKWTQRDR